MTDKLLLEVVPDCTERTGLGRTTLFAEIASGRLGSVRVGRRRLVPTDALMAYVELLKSEAAEDRQATV